jgi:hypothetical protein
MPRRYRRSAAVLVAATAMLPAMVGPSGPAVGATAAPASQTAPQCDASQVKGEAPPYEGRSVSRLYDRLFTSGAAVPHLKRHVPQGLTTWPNWDGSGKPLLLLGMYRKHEESYLVGLDPDSKRHVGTVVVEESHLGGIAVVDDWLIAQDTSEPRDIPAVRRYRVSDLREAMFEAQSGEMPYLESVGEPQEVYGASYMDVAEGSLYIGRYSRGRTKSRLFRYEVDDRGMLHEVEGPWKVPPRTQGVLVTPHHFLFANSDGNRYGQLRAFRRSADLSLTPVGCLWTPTLPQNLTYFSGRVFMAYESGASRFWRPHNRIKHLHTASLPALLRVMDPEMIRGSRVDPRAR